MKCSTTEAKASLHSNRSISSIRIPAFFSAWAVAGIGELGRLIDRAAGRITVMPGSGITAATVGELRGLSPRAVHASCGMAVAEDPAVVRLGFGPVDRRETSEQAVRELVAEVRAW